MRITSQIRKWHFAPAPDDLLTYFLFPPQVDNFLIPDDTKNRYLQKAFGYSMYFILALTLQAHSIPERMLFKYIPMWLVVVYGMLRFELSGKIINSKIKLELLCCMCT